jgi:hypothetical protein
MADYECIAYMLQSQKNTFSVKTDNINRLAPSISTYFHLYVTYNGSFLPAASDTPTKVGDTLIS